MSDNLKIWFAVATLFYVGAFVVWARLAHAIRGKYGAAAAVMFMPLIVAAAVESVSCAWLVMASLDPNAKAATFSVLISPLMAFGTLVVGAWGLVRLQCPDACSTRSSVRGLVRELVKSVPD